ncbi:hypothetical protein KIH39_19400 [Telmatocola sphagniphila]|uniref:Uncharacterized protein n=1 Tax=Telmatocola sphagniphila TaxID=1123043 RepID=A0A8E6EU65_9BACT|nr:hypothetical protein [Telmatocola sphagniphila]QVL31000.1 hypothetical protein KIH39_19400 [Telmatocola sphagniphila]
MREPSNQDNFSHHSELPEPFRVAVEAILNEPAPKLISSQFDFLRTRPVRTPSYAWMIRGAACSAVCAAAILLLLAMTFSPSDAWSQVLKNAQKQAWIRITENGAEKNKTSEIWFSATKGMFAIVSPEEVSFANFDEKKIQKFDRRTKTITVGEFDSDNRTEAMAFDNVFRSISASKLVSLDRIGEGKIVDRRTTTRNEGDHRWTEYMFLLEFRNSSPANLQLTYHVPAETELANKIVEEWTEEGVRVSRTCKIDYPSSGPETIYALNVPNESKIVDTRYTEELKVLLKEYVKQQKTQFDPYSATVMSTIVDWKEINLDVIKLQYTGSEYSAKQVDGDQIFKLVREADPTKVPAADDRIKWWKEQVDKLCFETWGDKNMFFPGQTFVPDLIGHPLLGLVPYNLRVTMNSKPQIGPSNCNLVTVEDAKTGKILNRYWLSPDQQLLCLRSERFPEKPIDLISVTVIEEVEQSPKGRYYATLYRQGEVKQSGDDLKPTGVSPGATVIRKFLVEFSK